MSNKIYLVAAYGGEYDESWEEILGAFTSESEAEAAVPAFEERYERLRKFCSVSIDAYEKAAAEGAANGLFNLKTMPRLPKRDKTSRMTDGQFAAKLKAHQIEAERVAEENAKIYSDFYANVQLAADNAVLDAGATPEDLLAMRNSSFSANERASFRVFDVPFNVPASTDTFVVVRASGTFDDYRETNICAYTTQEGAEECVRLRNADAKRYSLLRTAVVNLLNDITSGSVPWITPTACHSVFLARLWEQSGIRDVTPDDLIAVGLAWNAGTSPVYSFDPRGFVQTLFFYNKIKSINWKPDGH